MAKSNENPTKQNSQQIEINSLRDSFKDNIRILSSIGQFSYILKIQVHQYDVSLTLQLDESYPSKSPEIILTAPRLDPEQIHHVQQLLQTYAESLQNQPMILSIYTRLLEWLNENNIHKLNDNSSTQRTSHPPVPSNQQQEQTKVSSNETTDNTQTKKLPMKTADDVISRIEWDERLDKRFFRVGYIDRFLGLQEKSFLDFDFQIDLSTISDRHSNVLAIPKHRIQYFKYNNEIIWDKDTRTDLMFGSTGNHQTIYDVIERHENLLEINTNSSITDNDGIEENDNSILSVRYLTLTDGAYKPNYYLSIPITHPIIIENCMNFREHLLSTYPNYFSPRHTNSPSLHITLLTLRIENPSQIKQFQIVLKRFQEEIRYHCSYPDALCLEFSGIGLFHEKILYVKCQTNTRLERLRQLIVERFCEEQTKQNLNEVFLAGNYATFQPHMTLLKSKRKFPLNYLQDIRETYFGKQTIENLQLSVIGKTEQDEQLANCLFTLDLS